MTSEAVREVHKTIVKRMIKTRKFDLHHEMAEKLIKTNTAEEFQVILQEYDQKLTEMGL